MYNYSGNKVLEQMAQFAYDPYPVGKTIEQERKINEDLLHTWSKNHQYRTSYGSMFTDVKSGVNVK